MPTIFFQTSGDDTSSFSRLPSAGPTCDGLAPARLDVARERRDVARFFARLVGGVFLGARIAQDVAERGGQRQRALLAMQDRGERPQRVEIGELDLLLLVELVADGGLQIDVELRD